MANEVAQDKKYIVLINGKAYQMNKQAMLGVILQAAKLFHNTSRKMIYFAIKGNTAIAKKDEFDTYDELDAATKQYEAYGFKVYSTQTPLQDIEDEKNR